MKRKAPPLAVDLLCVNERMRNTFAMTFSGPARDVARLASGERADIVIIDADGVGAREIWRAFREKHPRCPAIAVSAAAIELEGVAATIAKPIKIEQLIETIRRVAEEIEPDTANMSPMSDARVAKSHPFFSFLTESDADESSDEKTQEIQLLHPARDVREDAGPGISSDKQDFAAVCGTAEDIDCADERLVSLLYLPIAGRLLDALQTALEQAKKSHQAVAAGYRGSTLAVFHPGGCAAAVAATDATLQKLSQAVFPKGAFMIEALADGGGMSKPGSLAVRADVLIWKVAAWTYRGRLPVGLSPNQRVFLRHWPNLTRLLELPDAMRIAALLNEQPMSMSRVAEALRIPQRHVFAFCACAHAIGLLDVAKRAADHLIEPPPPKQPAHGERQFLGRLMHYLKGLVTG